MKKVHIVYKRIPFSNDIEAVAYFEDKPIDQHLHSGEYWMKFDWGFAGDKAVDGQEKSNYHDEEIMKIVNEDFELILGDQSRIVSKD